MLVMGTGAPHCVVSAQEGHFLASIYPWRCHIRGSFELVPLVKINIELLCIYLFHACFFRSYHHVDTYISVNMWLNNIFTLFYCTNVYIISLYIKILNQFIHLFDTAPRTVMMRIRYAVDYRRMPTQRKRKWNEVKIIIFFCVNMRKIDFWYVKVNVLLNFMTKS